MQTVKINSKIQKEAGINMEKDINTEVSNTQLPATEEKSESQRESAHSEIPVDQGTDQKGSGKRKMLF